LFSGSGFLGAYPNWEKGAERDVSWT
jgi:hypothetical protein